MAKRKYLTHLNKFYSQIKLITISFIIVTTYSPYISATAWLPEPGKYKYNFSVNIIDETSNELKQARIELFVETENKITKLIQERIILINTPFYNKAAADSLDAQIKILQNLLCKLNAYQDEELITGSIEYGIKDNQSFGIKVIYKQNEFIDSKYSGTRTLSNTKTADIFYKYRLFHNEHYIVSLQPQISINKDNSYRREELFQELSILGGISKQRKSINSFAEIGFSLSSCISKSCNHKSYYSISVSEGIKIPYDFILANYSKYYVRKNYGQVYAKSIYEQISLAKEIKLDKPSDSSFMIQLGYFWDNSIIYKNLKISGAVFSIFLNF